MLIMDSWLLIRQVITIYTIKAVYIQVQHGSAISGRHLVIDPDKELLWA